MNLKSSLLVSALAVAGTANADLLSLYNFNDASTMGTSATNAALLLSADGGVLQGTTVLTTTAAVVNVVSFGGTITNANAGDVSGAALAIQAGTNNVNNGTSLILKATANAGTTLSALSFSFAGQRTGTGFNSYQLAYSVNGGVFTDFDSAFDLDRGGNGFAGFGNGTTAVASSIRAFDLSSIGSRIETVSLRLTYTGATTSAANFRLDNLQLNGNVQAVPEPASLAALGLGALALVRRRRK